jgi:hypothetical protein
MPNAEPKDWGRANRGDRPPRYRRWAGQFKPSCSRNDGERTRPDTFDSDLSREEPSDILAFPADVAGKFDADGVLSRPGHPHRPDEQILVLELSESEWLSGSVFLLIHHLSDTMRIRKII